MHSSHNNCSVIFLRFSSWCTSLQSGISSLGDESQLKLSPTLFNSMRDKPECLVLDVREKSERAACHIGGVHIPKLEVEQRMDELD
ncbi:MAG: hypothetical protein ACI9Y1_001631 [Lentisphaeria bacterium]|jgi:hypothetical protein